MADDANQSQEKLLQKIEMTCREGQSCSAHPRYPEDMKKQVRELVEAGLPIKKISQGTGLSQASIRKWAIMYNQPEQIRILPVVREKTKTVTSQSPVALLKIRDIEIIIYSRVDQE